MRKTLAIARKQTSCGSYLIGSIAANLLARVAGLSEISVDAQYLDRATLSYVCAGQESFEQIDFALASAGLQRA